MPDLLEEGLILFNRGSYYDAHEKWEDLWRETEGPERVYVQGLVQAAVGLYHLKRGNWTGARAQLGKSIRNLGARPPGILGLETAALIAQLHAILQYLDEQSDAAQPPAVRILRLQ